MDYLGTDSDDTIDAIALKLSDWTNVYGKAGNDRITIGNGIVIGGAGNDVITGTTSNSTAAYWGSTSGVSVNLATGVALDGLGGTDTLINIRSVQGTGNNDSFIGSSGNDSFYGSGGSDSFVGGGGRDKVNYYFVKSTEASITYDIKTDTLIVKKNFSNGDKGTDTLSGITFIEFSGTGSDNVTLMKSNFAAVGGFLRSFVTSPIAVPSNAYTTGFKTGDFNGDGHADFLAITQVGLGTEPAPLIIGLGDGTGRFTDGTMDVFVSPPKHVVGGGRTLAADFNKDGVTDILQLDFGIDAPPYPGGLNGLYLSSASKKLANLTSTLNQKPAQNHALSAGDVNGDGYLDILINTLAGDGPGNELHLNDGSGRFVLRDELLPFPKSGGSTLSNTSSGMVDVNGDGFVDLILGKWDSVLTTPTSQVLLNDGTGNFTKISPVSLPPSPVPQEAVLDVKSIDLNGDNLPDLMISVTRGGGSATDHVEGYYKTAYIQLLVNKGSGQFVDETEARLPQSIQSGFAPGWFLELTAVDFNRDGYTDILGTGSGLGESVVLMNQGSGTFKHTWSSEADAKTVAADVNEDGLVDLITQSKSNAVVEFNTMTNGGVYKAAIDGNFLSASVGNDTLIGSPGRDMLKGRGGNDALNGGLGIDSAQYLGLRKDYVLAVGSGSSAFTVSDKVASRDGQDSLTAVERLVFADVKLALDLGGNAGLVVKILGAVFGQASVTNKSYVGIGLSYLDSGMSYQDLMQLAIDARLGGRSSNTDVVNLLYTNVVGSAPDAGSLAFYKGLLDDGTHTQGSLGVLAAETSINTTNINLVGLALTGVEFI